MRGLKGRFLAICCALGFLVGNAEAVPAEEADAPSAAALMDALMWGQESAAPSN